MQCYYSVFHSARALLYVRNYRERSHHCLIVAIRALYVSEKLRAAALRQTIVPRDFYDLDFILRNGFNLTNKEVIDLF